MSVPKPAKKRKIPRGMIYIAATIIAVILFGVFNREFGNVFYTITHLTPGFLVVGVVVTVIYFFFEGGIIRLLMRSQDIPMSMGASMKIGLIGIYYSYITPSSTGGQRICAVLGALPHIYAWEALIGKSRYTAVYLSGNGHKRRVNTFFWLHVL